MTHRWIKTSCVVVVLNAVLVLTSILHRQLTASVESPSSTSVTFPVVTSSTTDTRTTDTRTTDTRTTTTHTTDASEGDNGLNPEVVEFQKLRAAGLAPDLANLEAKPVPEDDKLMAELRRKAAEAFPISEGLSEPQSVLSQSAKTASVQNPLPDTALARKSHLLSKLSAAHVDLTNLAQHFESTGDSAQVKKASEQIQALEKIMQELLTTPAF